MTTVLGSITYSPDVKDPATEVLAGYVINRSQTVDEMLSKAGIDPNSVNCITTPLIGASRYAEVSLLVAVNSADNPSNAPNLLPGAGFLNGALSANRFTITVWEPFAGNAGKPGDGDTGGPIEGPGVGGGEIPDTLPDVEPDTGSSTREGFAPQGLTAPTYSTLALMNLGRAMRWRGMIQLSAQELMTSITGSAVIETMPDFSDTSGLWVLKFADPRLSLQAQGIAILSQGQDGTTALSGFAADQWNMLAENPLHLVAATCKTSTAYAPSESPTLSIPYDEGDIDVQDLVGIPSPQFWYKDKPWSAVEILDYYTTAATKNPGSESWDRYPISYDYKTVAGIQEEVGDMLNLDLRGRNIGEALDEIASRIGCVWLWDRFQMRLSLVKLDYGNTWLQNYTPGPTDLTNINMWHSANSPFRTGGGFNQITNEVPDLLYGTVHQTRHVSCWGKVTGGKSEVYVDNRASQSPDGVRVPGSEATAPHLAMAGSPRPPLYFQLNKLGRTGRVAFIGDHIPAFIGYQSNVADDGAPGWFKSPASAASDSLPSKPWNADTSASYKCEWWQKAWATSLADRLRVVVNRYNRAQYIIDGEVTLNRIPAYPGNSPMNRTCSSGFQYDQIHFGRGGVPLMYRMWGSNADALLLPHLMPDARVKSYGLGSQYRANGFVNLVHIPKRCGIVRIFLAKFVQLKVLKKDDNDQPYVWSYQFQEVFPNSLQNGTFSPGNEYGDGALGARGVALNLAEMTGSLTSAPTTNFDGGLLRYNATSTQTLIVRTAPKGVAPCYEYAHPSGFTMYYLMAPNGVDVTCPTSVPFTAPNPAWQKSGASGISDSQGGNIASILSGMMAATPNSNDNEAAYLRCRSLYDTALTYCLEHQGACSEELIRVLRSALYNCADVFPRGYKQYRRRNGKPILDIPPANETTA
jgi:hypothetical protein